MGAFGSQLSAVSQLELANGGKLQQKTPKHRLRGGDHRLKVPPAELDPGNDDHTGPRHGTNRRGNGYASGHVSREILKGGRAGVKSFPQETDGRLARMVRLCQDDNAPSAPERIH